MLGLIQIFEVRLTEVSKNYSVGEAGFAKEPSGGRDEHLATVAERSDA